MTKRLNEAVVENTSALVQKIKSARPGVPMSLNQAKEWLKTLMR